MEALWNEKLSARFAKAKTVKGTQTFHFVEPIPGTTKVWVKEVSSDVNKFEKKLANKYVHSTIIVKSNEVSSVLGKSGTSCGVGRL